MSNSDLPSPDFVTRIPATDRHGERLPVRELAMRIDRDGTWYYQGSPIRRQALVNLFARVLRREADGSYWLVTPAERGRIEVEDAPFTAIDVRATGEGEAQRLIFVTNVAVQVTAGKANPIRVSHGRDGGSPRPYILVRPGLEALISRSVYYQLVDLGVSKPSDGREVFGVWSDGVFFQLGALDPDHSH